MSARADEGIRFVFEIEVSDSERFQQLVEECVAISNDEPGTLVYDWYIDETRGVARLYEAYASLDALREHAGGRVFTEIGPQLLEVCSFVRGEGYGNTGSLEGRPGIAPMKYWGEAFAAVDH